MRTSRRVGVVVFLLVVAAAAVAVLSPGSSTQPTTALTTNDGFNSGAAGMRVYMDPETGEPGAQPDANAVIELNPELENAMRHDDEGLTQVTHPNGAVSMNLEGRYAEATIVRIDENGKMIFCTDDVHSLEKNPTVTTPEVE